MRPSPNGSTRRSQRDLAVAVADAYRRELDSNTTLVAAVHPNLSPPGSGRIGVLLALALPDDAHFPTVLEQVRALARSPEQEGPSLYSHRDNVVWVDPAHLPASRLSERLDAAVEEDRKRRADAEATARAAEAEVLTLVETLDARRRDGPPA
jgi:hypothetical protein